MNTVLLPVLDRLYFLRNAEKGNSGFTYGLKEFNRSEMEISK